MTRVTFEILAILWIDDDDYYSEVIMLFSYGFLWGWRIEDCDRLTGRIKMYKDDDLRWW